MDDVGQWITGTESAGALEPLKQRYNSQHYALLRFYYECSNLKYLTSLISVPKLPQVKSICMQYCPLVFEIFSSNMCIYRH